MPRFDPRRKVMYLQLIWVKMPRFLMQLCYKEVLKALYNRIGNFIDLEQEFNLKVDKWMIKSWSRSICERVYKRSWRFHGENGNLFKYSDIGKLCLGAPTPIQWDIFGGSALKIQVIRSRRKT